jgi:GT2 family glycosyltransferase
VAWTPAARADARRPGHVTQLISIVICSIDAAKFAAVQASYAAAMGAAPYEIVGIHDAHSMCEGYNRGAAQARGDMCIFSHDDIEILAEDLAATLARDLRDRDVVGVAGTTRLAGMGWANSGIRHARGMITHMIEGDYDIRFFGTQAPVCEGMEALDGVFMAMRREVALQIRFDSATFDGWHGYDTDFTFRCHLAGLKIAVTLDVPLVHFSNANVDAAWLEYDRRFRAKHAAQLGNEQGAWLHVHRRVRTRADIRAAYDLPRLAALTAEIDRQAATLEAARIR